MSSNIIAGKYCTTLAGTKKWLMDHGRLPGLHYDPIDEVDCLVYSIEGALANLDIPCLPMPMEVPLKLLAPKRVRNEALPEWEKEKKIQRGKHGKKATTKEEEAQAAPLVVEPETEETAPMAEPAAEPVAEPTPEPVSEVEPVVATPTRSKRRAAKAAAVTVPPVEEKKEAPPAAPTNKPSKREV